MAEPRFQLTVDSKEAPLAVMSVTVDAQLRKRNMKGFCANPHPHPTPPQNTKEAIKENSKIVIRMLM